MFLHRIVLSVAFGLPVTLAFAQQSDPQAVLDRASRQPVGDGTRALLEIQRNGSQAGPGLPMTGEQAALAYGRYMESFRYAIPEFFTSQATGSSLRGGVGSQPVNGQ